MKFPLLVLFATGALSAPFFGSSTFNFNNYFFEDDCSDPRLRQDATTIFKYEAETLNTVQGSTSDSTGLKLKARVYIHPHGACKYSMQINNPELFVKGKNQEFQIAPESRKFSRELQAQELIFTTSKGRINKLFPAEREALHVLNIKRGIISTLQLQTDATEEIDVNGKCKVEFSNKDGGVIVKTKDLSECSDRVLNEIGLQTANFAHNKMPVKPLTSKSICHYELDSSEKIKSVQCDESHIFRPFSAGYSKPAGAITTVKQEMKVEGVKKTSRFSVETKLDATAKAASLIYGHEKETAKPDNSIISRIEAVMTALVKSGSLSVKQSSAHEFVQLVNLIRKLDMKRMRPVMDKYFYYASSDEAVKSVYRRYILDALTYCGTPTCVKTVHDVIVSGDVTGESRNMFLQGISLVAKPTKQMIRDVLSITKKTPSRQAYLALGTLIQRYCRIDAANCAPARNNPVTIAENFLEGKLGQNCNDQANHVRAEEILMALKAIGNARQPSRVQDVLLGCVTESKHMNITTAALDALKRLPCDESIQTYLHQLLEDVDIDVEKRIQTYITLMNCPQEPTIRKVVKHLESEKSSQVGSFILSHLRNIIESSDPKHNETQKILSDLMKGKDFSKFDLPLTKFSKAFEGSLYSKYLKSGATVNGHLIYNPDSFIPKSSLLSLSANILDVPVEVFEMAARIDGVESIVEDFFGPYGYFPDDTVVNFFKSKFKKEDLEKLRTRRSIEENYEQSANEFHSTVNKKKKPNGFLSMKVLGHEMRIFSLDDLQWAADEIDNMNVIELLLKVAKGGSKTFTKSIMFMEMTHTAPTGLGLPIKLKLTGSAVGSLALDGKFDIRNMFWGPMALEIKGSIIPSTVVEVSGQMGVHSQYADVGMFLNSSVFTSQALKGSILYREGQQLKINIDAPEKPIEFFNVSSTPFMFANEDLKLVEGTKRRITPDFCMNSKMILGLGLCTRVSVPVAFRDYEAPYYPLTGPASFGLKLVKADPKLTTYQFLVSLTKRRLSAGSELIGTFQVGTPGATYSRGVEGSIKYKETTNDREITIGNENSNTELKIKYQNNTNRFEVTFGTDAITPKPVSLKLLYFNDTSYLKKEFGILASASYDWYKFQHVTKFVRKLSPRKSFLLHSRTAYWPGKYITGEAEFTPEENKVSLRFDANQFNQKMQMDGKIISTDTEKGIDFTTTHFTSSKRISFYTGYVNTANVKKLVFNVKTEKSKPVELILGYYLTGKRHEIRFDASILGRSGKLFVDYSNLRTGWYGVNLGGIVEENSIGLATSYNNEGIMNQHGCIVAYFNEKRPAKVCLSLKDRKLTWSAEVLKKTASVSFGLKTSAETYTLDSVIAVQERELLRNVMEFTYKSLLENELKVVAYSGQKSVMARLFSVKANDNVNLFGLEGKGFGQFAKLQATYSTGRTGDANVYGVIFEGWINKKLPVSYTIFLENADTLKGVKTALNVMDYTAKTGLFFGTPKEAEYVVITDMSVQKNDLVLFGSKMTDVLVWIESSKTYKSTWEITVMNKKFTYGFDMNYEKRSNDIASRHIMNFGIDYAKNRRSSVKMDIRLSQPLYEVGIDVNYLPGKKVSHTFRYSAPARKLEISLEFLPNMYVQLSGQLDKVDGWQLKTDVTMSWSNFKKNLKSVATYINKDSLKGLNFQLSGFDQKLSVGSEYNAETKTLTLSSSALGRMARLTISFDKALGLGRVRLSMQQLKGNTLVMKDIVETLLRLSTTRFSYEMNAGQTRIFKIAGSLDRKMGSLELFVLGKAISKLSGQYTSEDTRATAHLKVLGTELFQVAARYNEARSNALLRVKILGGKDVLFVSKWNKDSKELTVAAEFMKKTIGVTARFDPSSYAAGFSVFYQKNLIGWNVAYLRDTSSLVYKVTLSPKISRQVVLQLIDDRAISLSLQRQTEYGYVSELTLKYTLASATSSFILQWNKGTVKQIKEFIVPLIMKSLEQITTMTKKASLLGQSLSMETVNKVGAKVLELIDTADKKFDEIDFMAVRDNLGAMTMKVMSNIAELTQKSIRLSSKALMVIHSKVPMMTQKAELYFTKAVSLSKVWLNEAVELAKVTYGATRSITEAGIPVAKLAFKLAKEFKIRGRTTEEIVLSLIKMGDKIFKAYKENMSLQIKKMTDDIKMYVAAVKIPFTDKKVAEVVKEYFIKVKSIDLKEKAREITKMVLEYELMGKSIMDHVKSLNKLIHTLPKRMKKMVVDVIRRQRLVIRNLKSRLVAFEPLVRCLKKIYASTEKHFGPLVENVARTVQLSMKKQYSLVYTPLKELALRVSKIVNEFIRPLVRPLRPLYEDIKMQVRAIRLLEKELGRSFDYYLDKFTLKLIDTYRKLYATAISYSEILRNMPSMTLEQIVEKSIDQVFAATGWTVVYAVAAYEDGLTTLNMLKKVALARMAMAKYLLDTYMNLPSEIIFSKIANEVKQKTMLLLSETSQFLDQIAELDIATPVERAWNKMDLINHLGRYGLNKRLTRLIADLKKVNAKQVVLEKIGAGKEMLSNMQGTFKKLSKKITELATDSVDYLKSIPEKDFEMWYSEIESSLAKTAMALTESLKMLYTRVIYAYSTAEKRAVKIYNDYEGPVKDAYKLVKERGLMVYNDVKDDCVITRDFYQTIIYAAATNQYKKLKKAIERQYEEIKDKIVAIYRKYEYNTWEEIGGMIYIAGKQRYDAVYAVAIQRYKQAQKWAKTALKRASDVQAKIENFARVNYQKIEKILIERVKPEAVKLYKTSMAYIQKKSKELQAAAVAAYEKASDEIFRIYAENKYLSIRQLSVKAKAVIIKFFKEYIAKVQRVAKENYAKVNSKVMQLVAIFKSDILPVLKEESVSIINQSLKAIVLLAEETIKAYKPHYMTARKYTDKYIEKASALGKKYYAKAAILGKKYGENSREMALRMYKKGAAHIIAQYTKLIAFMEGLVEKVKDNPRYQELIRTDAFIKIMKYVKWLREMVDKRIEEIKLKIEELKSHPRIYEMKKSFEELKEHKVIRDMLQNMQLAKKSALYSLDRINEKIQPKLKYYWTMMEKAPALTAANIEKFRRDPVTSFWKSVQQVRSLLKMIMEYNWKGLKTTIPRAVGEFYDDVTDYQTKVAVHKVKKLYKENYDYIMALPKILKTEVLRVYKERREMLKRYYAKLVEQWKESALYPIFANPIWSDIANEVMEHEITTELKKLSAKGLEKAKEIYVRVSTDMKGYMEEIKTKLTARYNAMLVVLDETTLEDIVMKVQKMYGKLTAKVMTKMQKLSAKANEKIQEYKEKVVAFSKKQYGVAKSYFDKEYPKLVAQMRQIYATYKKQIEKMHKKAIAKGMELRTKAMKYVINLWEKSSLKARIERMKRTTVGETYDLLTKLPRDTRKIYGDLSDLVTAKYNSLVRPYVKTAATNLKLFGNEINQTVVFVLRYYRLAENAKRLYKESIVKTYDLLPKLPIAAKKYFRSVSKTSLRAVHSTVRYMSKMDFKKLRTAYENVKKAIPDLNKYASISIDKDSMELRIAHPYEVKPSLSFHVSKVRRNVEQYADKVKTKTVAMTKALLKELRTRTMELRKDLNQSYLAHVGLVKHVQSRLPTYKRIAAEHHATAKKSIVEWYQFTSEVTAYFAKLGKKKAADVYQFGRNAYTSVLQAGSISEAYELAKIHAKQAASRVKMEFKPYLRLSRIIFSDIQKEATNLYKKVWMKVKPYYILAKEAGLRAAYDEVEKELVQVCEKAQNKLRSMIKDVMKELRSKFSQEDLDAVDQYTNLHSGILSKYAKRLYRMYTLNKVALDRTIRRSKMKFLYKLLNPLMRRINPLRTYAMIFGKRHVMTFDGKYYEFPKYAKPTCTYLLARDFKDGKFTIYSKEEKIITETPDVKISIDRYGVVEGLIKTTKAGSTRSQKISGLPIETPTAECKRWSHHIKCEFKQGVTIRCNVKHYLCTVELSGWNYGKSQGILGTNNRELYDEFKATNNKISSSLEQFANSWLVTRTSDCLVKESNNEAPLCNSAPSERCYDLFKSSSSPLAKHFKEVDPLPFMKACQVDTADCEEQLSYCYSVAAYRTLLKMGGTRASKVKDCYSREAGKSWTVKQKKDADIVVVMSARKEARSYKKLIASMLYNTNKQIKNMGFDGRYALISYGASTKGTYGARSHTFNGKYFSTENDIATEIKSMDYAGKKNDVNDYYQAILSAANMPFKPEAQRFIILFNLDKYSPSWYGPTADEVKFALKYEANASLFVFDKFNLGGFQKEYLKAIGITSKKIYMTPSLREFPLTKPLPKTPFTTFVKQNGGLFSNQITKKTEKIFTAALSRAILDELKEDVHLCKSCFWSKYKTVCRTDRSARCD